jgi:hypothetical protein
MVIPSHLRLVGNIKNCFVPVRFLCRITTSTWYKVTCFVIELDMENFEKKKVLTLEKDTKRIFTADESGNVEVQESGSGETKAVIRNPDGTTEEVILNSEGAENVRKVLTLKKKRRFIVDEAGNAEVLEDDKEELVAG